MSSQELKISDCRLCAISFSSLDLIPLKGDASATLELELKIHRCYNIQLSETEILPTSICTTCCDKVIQCFDFYQIVCTSQQVLINRAISLKQEPTKPVPDEEDIPEDPDIKLDELSESSWEEDIPVLKEESEEGDVEIKILEKSKWKCEDCSYETDVGNKLKVHCHSEHNKEPLFSCTKCERKYNKYESYLAHKRSHSGENRCDICGNVYRDKAYLKQHRKLHSDFAPFVCTHCNKSFKTAYLLKSHQRIHLPDELKLQFECDFCGKKFTRKQYLITHKELHTGKSSNGKEFVCEQCGRNFKQKGTLSQHMTTHVKEFLFRCELCPKAFKDAYGLRRHQKTHQQGQIYNCEICMKPFKHKKALRRHKNTHNNVYPYECDYCQKKFREKSYLKIHLRQHTGEKPYSCTECNQHFTNDSNFIKHIRGRHGLQRFSIANQRQFPFINK